MILGWGFQTTLTRLSTTGHPSRSSDGFFEAFPSLRSLNQPAKVCSVHPSELQSRPPSALMDIPDFPSLPLPKACRKLQPDRSEPCPLFLIVRGLFTSPFLLSHLPDFSLTSPARLVHCVWLLLFQGVLREEGWSKPWDYSAPAYSSLASLLYST